MDALWYFAYGSNLDPDTFLRRRGMHPLAAARTVLQGYRLTFDLPVGPGERGVANVRADPDAVVHGVAYLVTTAEAEFLDKTEGVPKVYQRRPVRLAPSPVGVPASLSGAAFTYESPHGVDGRKPSARYLGLILRGAKHHALPAAWIDELERLELAVDERAAGA